MSHPERMTPGLSSSEFVREKRLGEQLFESPAKLEKINYPLSTSTFALFKDRVAFSGEDRSDRRSTREKEREASGVAFLNILIGVVAIAAPIALGITSIPVAWEQFGGLGIIGVGVIGLWMLLWCATAMFKNLKKIGDLTKD